MVGGDDQRAPHPGVLATDPREPEVDEEEGLEEGAGEHVQGAVDAVLARESVVAEQPLLIHGAERDNTPAAASYRLLERLPGGSHQAARRIASRSARSSSPGVIAEELRPRDRGLDHLVDAVAVRPPARPGDALAGELPDPVADALGIGPQSRRERLDLLRRALAHRRDCHREQRRIGLGVRECPAPGPGSVRARGGARSRLGRPRSRRAGRRGRARSGPDRRGSASSERAISSAARRAALRDVLVGERRVERLGPVGERVHRGGAELGLGRAGHQRRDPRAPAPGARPRRPRGRPAAGGSPSSGRRRGWSGSPPPRPREPPRSPWPSRSPGRRRGRPAGPSRRPRAPPRPPRAPARRRRGGSPAAA